jgi:hypothetical protein
MFNHPVGIRRHPSPEGNFMPPQLLIKHFLIKDKDILRYSKKG